MTNVFSWRIQNLVARLGGCIAIAMPFQAVLADCFNNLGNYEIAYSGSVFGPGLMTLSQSPMEQDHYLFHTEIYSREQSENKNSAIVIDGIGSCQDGIFKIRLGANAGENKKYKILGGSTIGVMQPDVNDQQFGYWEVMILDKETSDHQEMKGVWLVTSKLIDTNYSEIKTNQKEKY